MSSKLTLPEYTYYYGFTKEQIIALADLPYKQALLSKPYSARLNLLNLCYLDYLINPLRSRILLGVTM